MQQRPREARHEDKMLEFRRPEPKAALTWIAVWLIALIGLAIIPMDEARPEFAAMPNEIHYSHGMNVEFPGEIGQPVKVQG